MTFVTVAADPAAPPATGLGFWGAVGLAAAIATALATGISTAVSIWWRYQDRTEAEWFPHVETRGGQDRFGDPTREPEVGFVLQNIGDGTAHQVRITGTLLEKEPWVAEAALTDARWGRSAVRQPIPAVRIGESVYVTAKATGFDVWDRAEIEVAWWPPPTRKKKDWGIRSREQRQIFKLSDITPAPTDIKRTGR
ncbi:membrane protein [Gordonia phage Posh]|nr:membrane protein [Gordonia phage Posh]